MEMAIGIALIISFFGLAYYCIKGYNLMIGFLGITVLWTILPLVGTLFASSDFLAANPILDISKTEGGVIAILNDIFQSGSESWGVTLVNVCWGAWFGRVLMDTGIASTLIKKTVELGGDKPYITVTLLNIVTAGIFTAMIGVGPTIAIGVIILPILMSLGVPKPVALFSYMACVAAGAYVNPVHFTQHRAYFLNPDEMPQFTFGWYANRWGFVALGIMVVVTTALAIFYIKKSRVSHAWAARTNNMNANANQNAPFYALLLPIIPVALKIWLDFSVIAGFIIAGFLALLFCGRFKGTFKENCQLVNKLYYDGMVDTAPLVGFLLVLPMFNRVAGYASPYFNEVIGPIMPKNEIVILVVFGALLCLGLFRGPLTLVGSGAATLGVLRNLGSFSVPFLYGVFEVPTITVNIGSCITQSYVAWGLAYTKVESKDFLKCSIPNAYITGILQYVSVFIMLTGFGAAWM